MRRLIRSLRVTTPTSKNKKGCYYSQHHDTGAYRSGLERSNADFLKARGVVPVEYEQYSICYNVPQRETKYTPDFVLPNGIIVETKGRFLPADRQKHLLIKERYPLLDIRFVFTSSREKLYKGSPTSYAEWCQKFGFIYADKLIPQTWLKEPCDPKRLLEVRSVLVPRTNNKKKR